ncbi:MAG: hypothetical protein WCJ09_16155 [Planctomycetota bacterium]
MNFIPILAAEPSIVFLVILIISLFSWVWNLFQGAEKPTKKKRPRPENSGASELELFLQQVVGDKPEAAKPRPDKPARPAGEKKQPRNKQQQARRPVEAQRPTERPASERADSDRPGKRLSQTHLQTSIMGEGIRPHVSTLQSDVGTNVRRDIDDPVQRDIGSDSTTTVNRPAEHPLIQTLRNPQGVRQAIILTEILNRPKSLR